MKSGRIEFPRNSGRIISTVNRQYRLGLGAIALETTILTLTYESAFRMGATWTFSQPFLAPPVISGSIFSLVSAVIFRDLAGWDTTLNEPGSVRIRLITNRSSPQSFSVGDSASLHLTAIGEM